MKKKSAKSLPVGKWLGYAALVILAIISIGPIWIAFKTALSGPTAWLSSAGSLVPARPSFLNASRKRAHIPGRSSPQVEIGAFSQARDEILDWFAVTLSCRLRVRCLLVFQPFEHPRPNGEIFKRFIASSLQDFVEQPAPA